MKHFFIYCWGLLFLLGIQSCVQTKQTYFLNQDGSGKVELEAGMMLEPEMQTQGGEPAATSYEDKVRMVKKVRKIVEKSKGGGSLEKPGVGVHELR